MLLNSCRPLSPSYPPRLSTVVDSRPFPNREFQIEKPNPEIRTPRILIHAFARPGVPRTTVCVPSRSSLSSAHDSGGRVHHSREPQPHSPGCPTSPPPARVAPAPRTCEPAFNPGHAGPRAKPRLTLIQPVRRTDLAARSRAQFQSYIQWAPATLACPHLALDLFLPSRTILSVLCVESPIFPDHYRPFATHHLLTTASAESTSLLLTAWACAPQVSLDPLFKVNYFSKCFFYSSPPPSDDVGRIVRL